MKRSHDQYSDRDGRDQRHGGDRSRRRYDDRGPDHQDSDRRSGPGHSGGSGNGGSRYGDPNRRDERRDNQYGHYGSGDSYHRSSSGGGYYGPSGSGSHERLHGSRVESSSYRPRLDRQMGHPGGRGGRSRDNSRGGGRGGRGGRGRGPDFSGLASCTTNIVPAEVTEGFQFFLYTVNIKESSGEQMESRHRRKMLFHTGFWDNLLKGLHIDEKNDLRRVVYFSGSYFCSGRPIPGLERSKLPVQLPLGKEEELGETVEIVQVFHYLAPNELRGIPSAVSQNEVAFDSRCADCTRCFADQGSVLQHCRDAGHRPVYVPDSKSPTSPIPATLPVFVSYINCVLHRALLERLSRWGNEYIDPNDFSEPRDRRGNKLGVSVYRAYSAQFNVLKKASEGGDGQVQLALTVDLRAKVVRTKSLLEILANGRNPSTYKPSPQEIETAKREWIGEVVIYKHDRKCYSVTDLLFDHSSSTLPVEGLGMYHSEYFQRKNTPLEYPNAKPMVAVLGRRNTTIYFPAELVTGNELERGVKEQLPQIASYQPRDRHDAIDRIRSFLVPGAQTSRGAGGLLPALGVQISNERISAKAKVLPLPMMQAAGVPVPKNKKENWAPVLNGADFKVNPGQANTLNAVVIYHERLAKGATQVFSRIRDFVNKYNATYRLSQEPVRMVRAGDRENHWEQVEKTFSDPSLSTQNIFVLDFTKPRGALDTAYPVVKQMLTKHGYISQFVNFNTYAHDAPKDQRRSHIILQGVARQILQKAGVRLWWVNIPRELPTPAVFVGVDVFHAPRVYDPIAKKRTAKASCAAIIVQVYRNASSEKATVELYSETYAREAGKEYDLRDALKTTISTALKELKCDPRSCIVWRDGIGESAFTSDAPDEIQGITEGLNSTPAGEVPLAYVVCQKRIDTKFFIKGISGHKDGDFAAPSGTLVEDIQGLTNHTFYINGRAPPYSTAKPVRFIVIRKDDELKQVSLPLLTWDMCHDYPNWTGPIKVPSVCQMAHKLAELAGNMVDCGRNINNKALKNKVHFL